jgi:DNA-binding PadR family transcriptional regulator
MTDIGKFRAVDAKDLREFAYGGDGKHLAADLTTLRREGLIVEREIPHQETAPRQLVALTKQGHRLLEATKHPSKDQALYHGISKPAKPITTQTFIGCTSEDSKRSPAREAQESGSSWTQN